MSKHSHEQFAEHLFSVIAVAFDQQHQLVCCAVSIDLLATVNVVLCNLRPEALMLM